MKAILKFQAKKSPSQYRRGTESNRNRGGGHMSSNQLSPARKNDANIHQTMTITKH